MVGLASNPERWHAEILIHAALLLLIWRRRTGRPNWEAWLVCRFVFDVGQLLAERMGHNDVAASVWYLGIIVGTWLLLRALHEAVDIRPTYHRRILFAWTALTMGAAWIRFFPYTGQAVLVIDAAAYVAWIVEIGLRSKSK